MVGNMWVYTNKYVLALILISILISISQLQIIPSTHIKTISPIQNQNIIEAYFMPIQADEALHRIVELINNSRYYVYVAAFMLSDTQIINSLIIVHKRGVDVRIVSDTDGGVEESTLLRLNNIPIIYDQRRGDYMHDKFIVIDNETVITGSANFNYRSFYKYNNDVVVIHDRDVAINYYLEFIELYHRIFGGGEPTHKPVAHIDNIVIKTFFSPEDHVAERIIYELLKANHTVYFATYAFTNYDIAEALVRLARKGVRVVGVFDSYMYSVLDSMEKIRAYLERGGVTVYLDINPYLMHCKLFIIDNHIVITGSYNPSYHAEHSNDENIVVIYSGEIGREYTWFFKNYLLPNGTRLYVRVVDELGNPLGGTNVVIRDLDKDTSLELRTNSTGYIVVYAPSIMPNDRVRIEATYYYLLIPAYNSTSTTIRLGPQYIVLRIAFPWDKVLAIVIVSIIIAVIILYRRR
jgi:phosphatidylserine/phosphatidylglycerophosphate/cardiolipin synthase-like enzyme